MLTDLQAAEASARQATSELRAALHDLKAERTAVERLIKTDAADLVLDEVTRQLRQIDVRDVVQMVMDGFRTRADDELSEFTKTSNRLLRQAGRAIETRITEANDVLLCLHNARAVWETGGTVPPVIPPAFRRIANGEALCPGSPSRSSPGCGSPRGDRARTP